MRPVRTAGDGARGGLRLVPRWPVPAHDLGAMREAAAWIERDRRRQGFPWRPSPAYWRAVQQWADQVLWAVLADLKTAPPDVRPLPPWTARAAFIVGLPRSGTTLLRDLLDGHPQLLLLPIETHALTRLAGKYRRFAPVEQAAALAADWSQQVAFGARPSELFRLGRAGKPYLDLARRIARRGLGAYAAGRPMAASLLGALAWSWREVAPAAAGSAPRWWVEKTPLNELWIEQLRAFFPGAPLLHVLRHPRDVLRSRLALEEWVSPHPTHPTLLLDRMARSYRVARDNVDDPACLFVPYEKLVGNRRAMMEAVAQHLGVDWRERLLRPEAAGRPVEPNSSFGGDRSTADRSRWDVDATVISAAVGELVAGLGYGDLPEASRWARARFRLQVLGMRLGRRGWWRER